jgi:uncharacterized membrane protein
MAKDVGDLIGTAIGRVARETVQSVAASNKKRGGGINLSGGRGLAAGAGLASLAPLAYKGAKGAKNLMGGGSGNGSGGNPISKAKSKVEGNLKDKVEGNVKDKAKEGVKDALPFGGGGNKNDEAGVGKGRRMPIQQSMDIGAPLKTVYNEWTQFEEWPQFMHRLESVSQEEDTQVKVKVKIWGKSKEFTADILEQVPDERIKWEVSEGITHTGVVTFSELAPNLTHVEVNMDVQPGSLLEKAARGMRHIKRAVRADLHRFKAHVMMNQEEQGAWRGTIDDGEVKRTRSSSSSSGGGSSSGSSSGSRSGSRSRSAASSSRSRSRSTGGSSSSSRKRSSSPARKTSSSSARKTSSSGAKKPASSSAKKSSSSRSSGGSNGSSARSSRSRASGSSSSRSKSSSNGRSTTGRSKPAANGRKKAGSRS